MKKQTENLYITVNEYLQGEPLAEIRHEYIRGEVYGRGGCSDAHESHIKYSILVKN